MIRCEVSSKFQGYKISLGHIVRAPQKAEKQEKKAEERMRGVAGKEKEEEGKRRGGEEKQLIILKMFKLSILCVLHVGSLN